MYIDIYSYINVYIFLDESIHRCIYTPKTYVYIYTNVYICIYIYMYI